MRWQNALEGGSFISENEKFNRKQQTRKYTCINNIVRQ